MMAEWKVTWLYQLQTWLQAIWSVKTQQKLTGMQRKGLRHLIEPVVDYLVNLKYCSKFLINSQSPRK